MKKECYKQCQSCGMPLKKDPHGGGTEVDGRKSCVYCSSCYKNGHFINDMTMEEMQNLVDRVLREEMEASRLFRWLAVRQVPKLKRWKQESQVT